MKHITIHPAIAMIELIFALVIIGIVMMSIPFLLQQSTQSTLSFVQQTDITKASTIMQHTLNQPWDKIQSLSTSDINYTIDIKVTYTHFKLPNTKIVSYTPTYSDTPTPIKKITLKLIHKLSKQIISLNAFSCKIVRD